MSASQARGWHFSPHSGGVKIYEATTLDGGWFGTPEQGLEVGCMYLQD